MRTAAYLLAVFLLAPAVSRAELYKCRGPDGKTLFTSDRSQCPGAEAHQPSGSLQRTGPSTPAPRPAARQAAPDEEVEAQAWRDKRLRAEAALRAAEAKIATLHEAAGWCNRGHVVIAEDEDGLRHDVDCDEIDAREKELRREQKKLAAYLEEGLEEECRRAGCLPGWLR
jgi:hypothetical protein